MQSNVWFPAARMSPARMRLFCFPSAGGGSAPYVTWRQGLPQAVEVLPARMPGREHRVRESSITEFPLLLESMVGEVEGLARVPFAFFGHSLGALVAFELTRLLRARGSAPCPTTLFVAARSAPQLPPPPPLYHLPPDQFLTGLQGALRRIRRRDPPRSPLLRAFKPILRADLTLFDTYRYTSDAPLACPIVALGGSTDRARVSPHCDPGMNRPRGNSAARSTREGISSSARTRLSCENSWPTWPTISPHP